MSKQTTPRRASRRAAPHCSHLLGTAMRTIDGQHIIVYVTDWAKASAYKQIDKYNFCPKCGRSVNDNARGESLPPNTPEAKYLEEQHHDRQD